MKIIDVSKVKFNELSFSVLKVQWQEKIHYLRLLKLEICKRKNLLGHILQQTFHSPIAVSLELSKHEGNLVPADFPTPPWPTTATVIF